jgi:hypothetical protein
MIWQILLFESVRQARSAIQGCIVAALSAANDWNATRTMIHPDEPHDASFNNQIGCADWRMGAGSSRCES